MHHRISIIAIAASLATVPMALQAQDRTQDRQAPMTPAERAGQTLPAFTAEQFMQTAARSGHAEVQAARLAIDRGVDGAVRDFAQRLIDDHTKANERLRELAARQQVELPQQPSASQRSQLTVLRDKRGEDFEFAFVNMFGVAAHQASIAEFRRAVRTGNDDAVVDFARTTLPVLEDHLARAETLQTRLAARAGDAGTLGQDRANRTSGAMAPAAGIGAGMAAGTNPRSDTDMSTMQAAAENRQTANTIKDARNQVDDAVQVVQRMKSDPEVTAALGEAQGIVILPNYGRAGLGIGAQGGEGVLVTRQDDGFGHPVFFNMAGISIGAQAGGSGGPIAMLLMTERAVDEFVSGKNLSLNADAGLTVADFSERAQVSGGKVQDVLIWSGTRGAYAGASIGVTTVTYDDEDNAAYYGREDVTARDILDGEVEMPGHNVLGMVLDT